MTGPRAQQTPEPEEDDEEAARDAEAGEPIKATPTANPARVRVPPEGPRPLGNDEPHRPGHPDAEEEA